MKALSIRQPWPWAILHLPLELRKTIENRDWQPQNSAVSQAKRLIASGEEFLIHASLTFDRDDIESVRDIVERLGGDPAIVPAPRHDLALDDPDNPYPTGGIVGKARLTGMVFESPSPWFFGPRGLVLADAEPLPFRRLKGALGFFGVPDEIARLAA